MTHRSFRCRRSALASAALAVLTQPALATDYTWTNGFFVPGVTAPSPLLAGDQLFIDSGGFKYLSAVTFSNQSTVQWRADNLYLQGGAVVENLGLWDAQSDNTLVYNGGAVSSFVNTGTFRKSGGSGSTVVQAGVGFVNHGTVDAQTGSIRFDGGSVFHAGSAFTGAGRVVMAAGTNTINGAFSSESLWLQGGHFTGGGAVATGSLAWSGGTLAGSWQVAAGSSMNIEAGGFKYLGGAGTVLDNLGTVAWNTTNALYLQGGAVLSNQALFVANADTSLVNNGGALPGFSNSATATLRAAADKTLSVGAVAFVNDGGILDAQAGATIEFGGGHARFNDGTRFTGAGRNLVSWDAQFHGGFDSANLVLQNGTFTGNAAVLRGSVTTTGGTLAGTWQVDAGSTLNGEAGGFKYLSGAGTVLDNLGTVAWNTTNALYLQGGAVFSNQALFVANADTSLAYNGGALPGFSNSATATLRAAADKTLSVGAVAFVNDGGILDAQAGATIEFGGGHARFNDGTRFTGAGRNLVSWDAQFHGGFDSANLVLQNGTFTGNAAVLRGSVTTTGGTLAGTWQVDAGSTLNGEAGGFKYLSGAGTVLDNLGTVAWNTANPLYLQGGAKLLNRALLVANADTGIAYNGGALAGFDNTASATLRAAAGKTLAIGAVAFVNDGGTLDAQAGATISFNGGNARFNDGTRFTGTGRNLVNSDAQFHGGFDSTNLVLQNGTFTGNAAVVRGNVAFAGGTLAGTWQVDAGSTLKGADGGFKYLGGAGTMLANQGSVVWDTANSLYVQGGATLQNQGVFDFRADGAIVYNGGAVVSVVNEGLIVKSAGAGTSTIGNGLGFVNLGTVDVQTGTLALPVNFSNQGTLAGLGRYSVAGTLTNAGTLAPGAAPGVLSLTGNFLQLEAGSFAVDLNSLLSSDRFDISGSAVLDGTLALSCYGACSFSVGQSVVILDSVGALSGSFDQVTMAGFGSGAFEVVYDTVADEVRLNITETVTAVPEPKAWALLLTGLLAVGWVARRRQRG